MEDATGTLGSLVLGTLVNVRELTHITESCYQPRSRSISSCPRFSPNAAFLIDDCDSMTDDELSSEKPFICVQLTQLTLPKSQHRCF